MTSSYAINYLYAWPFCKAVNARCAAFFTNRSESWTATSIKFGIALLAPQLREDSEILSLQQMNVEKRLVAEYAGTGLTVGKHPMYYRRPEVRREKILSAEE
jgi:hypothetical protein